MKKLTIFFSTVALLGSGGTTECLADYKDMANQVETIADIWLGGSFNETSSSINGSLAGEKALAEEAGRVAANKASEYYALKSSVSGGVLFKSAPLPHRFHFEFDYYNDSDWFGDLRYSYKDYLQLRLLPRRLTHNLENLTVYDFAPAVATTGSIDIRDRGVDDYRLRVDIDEYRLRLKVPNYPLHVYSLGEVIQKKGLRQVRFLGGDGQRGTTGQPPGQVRASVAREEDQKTLNMVVGTNAHLGPVEFDVSHKERKFESDLPVPTFDYTFGARELHVLPELKATSNTIKLHTSHTGRIFASATFSKLEKSNEYSHAEAESSFGYSEITWVPAAYFTMGAKFRHQKNESSAPATVRSVNRVGNTIDYVVSPAVESQTDTAIVTARYSLIPKTSANLQYTRQIKDVEGKSAVNWGRPQRTDKDVYELALTNWAIPRVRTTAKLSHTRIGNDYGEVSTDYQPVSIEPEHTSQGTLGVTWLVSPRITAFASGFISKEESDGNRLVGGHSNSKAKAFNQNHMMSLNFALSEKLSLSPSYSYLSWEQKRDIIWEGGNGDEVVDPDYSNKQKAQVFSLALASKPAKRLNINAVVDYIITKGSYDPQTLVLWNAGGGTTGNPPSNPFSFDAARAASFSWTETRELGIRLDGEYDLGRGWGVGIDLRYVDWSDTSTDNPTDSVYFGGLFKVSKKLLY